MTSEITLLHICSQIRSLEQFCSYYILLLKPQLSVKFIKILMLRFLYISLILDTHVLVIQHRFVCFDGDGSGILVICFNDLLIYLRITPYGY